MIVVQLVYVVPGREADFHAFEDAVLPLLPAHGGTLLLRVRPPPDAHVGGTLDPPYELHVIDFPDDAALARYAADPARTAVLARKDASVRAAWMIRGERVG